MKIIHHKFILKFLLVFLFLFIPILYAIDGNVLKPEIHDQPLKTKIQEHRTLNYMVIGDSIGRGSGVEHAHQTWFAQLEDLMKAEYNIDMDGEYIVQSGSTAFEGLYKLKNANLKTEADMIFLVFGENDRKYMQESDFAIFYEELYRKAKMQSPSAEVFTIIESPLTYEGFADQIKDITNYYGGTYMDMRKEFKKSGKSTKQLTKDYIHPNYIGYRLYAEKIFDVLKSFPVKSPNMLKEPKYITGDFTLTSNQEFTSQKGFTYRRGYLITKKADSRVSFNFKGTMVGAILLRGPDGGTVDVYIDGEYNSTLSTWWPFPRERYIYIENGLSSGPHTIELVSTGKKTKNNLTNQATVKIAGIIAHVKDKE